MKTLTAIIAIAVLLLSCTACAEAAGAANNPAYDGIVVNRTLPADAVAGGKAVITLTLTNTGSAQKAVTLTEFANPSAGYDESVVMKTTTTIDSEHWICYGPGCGKDNKSPLGGYTRTSVYYRWNFNLAPGGTKQVSYWAVPKTAGDFWIRSAGLTVDGKEYSLPPQFFAVACTAGHACDPSLGENAITCPENCRASVSDKACSPVKDGACDPDCTAGIDPDCGGKPGSGGISVSPVLIAGIIAVIAVAAGAGFWLLKKRKK